MERRITCKVNYGKSVFVAESQCAALARNVKSIAGAGKSKC